MKTPMVSVNCLLFTTVCISQGSAWHFSGVMDKLTLQYKVPVKCHQHSTFQKSLKSVELFKI